MAVTARPRASPGCSSAALVALAVALCAVAPARTSNPLSPAASAADCAGKGKTGSNCSVAHLGTPHGLLDESPPPSLC
ncbi:hypothetical protein lerEdw1_015049 [Lerista edwardsae]|nr:hypothetical protein lerEdw1_015049 [Lerista edwardsae]